MTEIQVSDLLTGAVLGEIRSTSTERTEVLSAPGSLVVAGPLRQEAADEIPFVTIDNVREGGTGLWVKEGSGFRWGGILWDISADVATNTMTLTAEGFHSYARHRVLTEDLVFSQVDQAQIAHDLVAHMQAVEGGDVGIVTDMNATPTGRRRDRTYRGHELTTYGKLLENLAAVEGGADFVYRAGEDSGGNPTVRLDTLYPKTGRPSNATFELDSNCSVVGYRSSGQALASRAHSTGAGQGASRVRSTVDDPAGRDGRPLLEARESFGTVSRVDTLDEHGDRRVQLGRRPIKTLTMRVTAGSDLDNEGVVELGDSVDAAGRYGLAVIDGTYRVTQIKRSDSKADGSTAVYTLADVQAFQ